MANSLYAVSMLWVPFDKDAAKGAKTETALAEKQIQAANANVAILRAKKHLSKKHRNHLDNLRIVVRPIVDTQQRAY